MSFRVASSPHFLRTTFGLFDVHDHIHSSWEKVAEWTSCILKYFFSLAQVQIPKTNLWRDLYMDSTMATISGIFTSQLQSCVCSFFFFLKKKNFMGPFYRRGSTVSRLQPLRGGSLLFTTKFSDIPGTHFTDLGRIKSWVNLGATQWFWTRGTWIGNPAP